MLNLQFYCILQFIIFYKKTQFIRKILGRSQGSSGRQNGFGKQARTKARLLRKSQLILGKRHRYSPPQGKSFNSLFLYSHWTQYAIIAHEINSKQFLSLCVDRFIHFFSEGNAHPTGQSLFRFSGLVGQHLEFPSWKTEPHISRLTSLQFAFNISVQMLRGQKCSLSHRICHLPDA